MFMTARRHVLIWRLMVHLSARQSSPSAALEGDQTQQAVDKLNLSGGLPRLEVSLDRREVEAFLTNYLLFMTKNN